MLMQNKVDRMNKQWASFYMKEKWGVFSIMLLIEEMA